MSLLLYSTNVTRPVHEIENGAREPLAGTEVPITHDEDRDQVVQKSVIAWKFLPIHE
jgi:hypothetical protein